MANINTPFTFSNSTVADATQVNANFAEIANVLNSTGLDSSGLGTSSVSTAKIADSAVTTVKLADANVTQAKLAARATGTSVAAGGVALSITSGAFSTTSLSAVAVTGAALAPLTVTLVTTGRPVHVGLIPDGTSNFSELKATASPGTQAAASFQLLRDGVVVARTLVSYSDGSSGNKTIDTPCSSFNLIDFPVAGTYVYTLQALLAAGTNAQVNYTKIVAYEL